MSRALASVRRLGEARKVHVSELRREEEMNRAECDRCGVQREFVSEPRLRRACENCGHLADSEASSAQFPIHVSAVIETDTPIPVSIAYSSSSEAAPATEAMPPAAADAA